MPEGHATVKVYGKYSFNTVYEAGAKPQARNPPRSLTKEHASMTSDPAATVDVRTIVPRERHSLIFGKFHSLAPGEAFVLVNDHDPKPLYYHFKAELGESFGWDYLESGPEIWRVRIGRSA
jgi:uncharacterized protein (DUF2249 family)